MKGLLTQLRSLFNSLTGRVVMILTGGMAAASIVSLLVADYARVRDFERARSDGVVESAVDISARLARDPAGTAEALRSGRIFGVREVSPAWSDKPSDPKLERLLIARLGQQSRPAAALMPVKACFQNVNLETRAAGIEEQTLPDCWFVRFRDSGGIDRYLRMEIAAIKLPPNSTLGPIYPVLIVCMSAFLAFFVARVATAPLGQLTEAARTFSVAVDPEAIPERGPSEVRAALRTFNIMQQRVRDGLRERTQVLASIAHDLQTPLTRHRLRLEKVGDAALKAKLVSDLAIMQRLIQDNLDLAGSLETREPWSEVDIDSILSSVAEDAADIGAAVRFSQGCGAHARIRPNALLRCLNNLVDNAVKYAGDAELSCSLDGQDIVICVRDHGPGIPEHALEWALEPFHRFRNGLTDSVGGTGIGLSIARAQAQTFNAVLALRNLPEGGLLASIRLRHA